MGFSNRKISAQIYFLSFIKLRHTLNSQTQVYWLSQVRCKSLQPIIHAQCNFHRLILLLISGIEPNHAPAAWYPCDICGHEVEDLGRPSLACNVCDQWSHKSCLGMNTSVFEPYANTSVSLFCPRCSSPNNSSVVYDIPVAEDTSLGSIFFSVDDDDDEQLTYPIHVTHNTQNGECCVSSNIIEPRHEISSNVVCATSKGSDQPAHMRSLIRAFASHMNILLLLSY